MFESTNYNWVWSVVPLGISRLHTTVRGYGWVRKSVVLWISYKVRELLHWHQGSSGRVHSYRLVIYHPPLSLPSACWEDRASPYHFQHIERCFSTMKTSTTIFSSLIIIFSSLMNKLNNCNIPKIMFSSLAYHPCMHSHLGLKFKLILKKTETWSAMILCEQLLIKCHSQLRV